MFAHVTDRISPTVKANAGITSSCLSEWKRKLIWEIRPLRQAGYNIHAYTACEARTTAFEGFPKRIFYLESCRQYDQIETPVSCCVRRQAFGVVLLDVSCSCGVERSVACLVFDCVRVSAYVAPVDSPYFAETDIECHVTKIEEYLLDLIERHGDLPVTLCGDMNARVDLSDKFTFTSEHGKSVVDYFAASEMLVPLVRSLVIVDRVESPHLPVHLSLCSVSRSAANSDVPNIHVQANLTQRLLWDPLKAQLMQHAAVSDGFRSKLEDAVQAMGTDINKSLSIFNEALIGAAECMQKTSTRPRANRVDHVFHINGTIQTAQVKSALQEKP
ncbi:hypothetical protein BaRGS_00026340 [Batillaria attramentaria]|uniref:Endonuclease/exonuclease/phosphatase domain-containing protein n=1 Tax=Batillaria attramentaria TaxID=370345 RepID=A0ABD0K5R5_9CAEN